MNKKVILSIFFSIIIYGLIISFFGPKSLFTTIQKVPLSDIILAIGLVILSLVFEFFRWNYYLKQLKIKIKLKRNIAVFLSGLSLALLPSKSGELVRYAILKKDNIPFNKTVPIHFISNITGFAVVLGYSLPIILIMGNLNLFLISILIVSIFFFSLMKPGIYLTILDVIQRFTGMKIFASLKEGIISSKKLLKLKDLVITLFLTIIYHGILGWAFVTIARNFEITVPLYIAFSIYSISLILGVLSMLPGGIGAVEGGSLIMLSRYMASDSAVVLIILMRFITLWITMVIGVVALNFALFSKNQNKKLQKTVL